MAEIGLWGPIVPIGLAVATISSAIGSILVAPRTLQALAADGLVPEPRVNTFLARGVGVVNEPRNATLITVALVLATVSAGTERHLEQAGRQIFLGFPRLREVLFVSSQQRILIE